MRSWSFALIAAAVFAACGNPDDATPVTPVDAAPQIDGTGSDGAPPDAMRGPVTGTGRAWPEADALFHRGDPRWLGADAAYSVDLGDGRILWMFGDTFVATSAALTRSEARIVRNTVAIQDGRDPVVASFAPVWRTDASAVPAPFFPGVGDRWHWPGGGVRLPDGRLVIFLGVFRPTPGQGFGFAGDGWRLAIIDDPAGAPAGWTVRLVEPPAQAVPATVGVAAALVGDHVVALATGTGSTRPTYLARWPVAALGAGQLDAVEWWDGGAWVAAAGLTGAPATAFPDGTSEASLHHDPALERWLVTASHGFGATTLAVREAPRLDGPWTAPVDVFTPAESGGTRPFVYAGKAHPELTAPGLAMTYVASSFTFADLFTAAGMRDLYWPRFALVTLE